MLALLEAPAASPKLAVKSSKHQGSHGQDSIKGIIQVLCGILVEGPGLYVRLVLT